MRPNESSYSDDWFEIAEKDLKRARYLLDGKDVEGAGFNIQQAVEKYLKGYLLSRGWQLRRIHNLETLLNEAIKYHAAFEEFRAVCQKITQYYVEERYPVVTASDLTEDEITASLLAAENIIARIKAIV